jgi:ubiquinone/menaquinone biosynthesis C-methylase UbiE
VAARRADTRYLREVAYADPSGLAARASLYDFQQPRIDLQDEALTLLAPLDGRVVGDIGCGDGRYVDAVRAAGAHVVGIDLSVGMLAGVPTPTTLVAADAQSLPLTDASLDVAMMMHMLYHVPDPAMAVAEAARTHEDAQRFVAMQFPEPFVHWLRSSVVVTDAAPVVRHAASTTAAQATGEHREELVGALSDAITARIGRDGQFTITTEVAFLTATRS